jgi:HEAT repeat protein
MPGHSLKRPLVIGAVVLLAAGVAVFLAMTRYATSGSSLPGRNLGDYTVEAVPRHIEALKAVDANARLKAAADLWQIGAAARSATPALLESTRDPVSEVRAAAARALGPASEGTTDAVSALLEALKDKDAPVRAEAAASLARIFLVEQKDTGGRRGGRGSRDREEEEEHERGARGRGRGRGQLAERDLREERERHQDQEKGRDQHEPGREGGTAAVDPLPRLKPEAEAAARTAVPVLAHALEDEDARVRAQAAIALGEMGPLAESAVPGLSRVLQDDADEEARLRAAIALGHTGPGAGSAVPVLVKHLRQDEFGVRANCACALAQIRTNPELAVPALLEAYLKDKADVYVWSMVALDRYGLAAARITLPLLQKAIKDPKNRDDKELQKRAAEALEISEQRVKELEPKQLRE